VYLGVGGAEVCDGIDNDGDGLVDEDDPSLVATAWYLDADGDGHGNPLSFELSCDAVPGTVAVSDDCDDTDADIHPGAVEICDAVDANCDNSVDYEVVTHEAPDGTLTDWSATFNAGTSTSPAVVTLPSYGTLAICSGSYYARMTAVAGTLTVMSPDGNVSVSAADTGRVLSVNSAATNLTLRDIRLTQGTVLTGSGTGGCYRQAAGTVVADNVDFQSSEAISGGGIYLAGGTLTLTGGSVYANDATDGGGVYIAGGTFAMTDTWVESNVAVNRGGGFYARGGFSVTRGDINRNDAAAGAGIYFDAAAGTVQLTNTDVSYNIATGYGGGAYLANAGLLSCTGTSSASAVEGFGRNRSASGGGVYLASSSARLRSTVCDWGATTPTSNRPNDILYGSTVYNKNDNATFLCAAGVCPP
jgi:hypothetical protein